MKWDNIEEKKFLQTKLFNYLAIIGLLLGLTSQIPILLGYSLYWNLTLVIISAILIIVACLETIQKGSKIVGIISLVYGVLATLFGSAFLLFVLISSLASYRSFVMDANAFPGVVLGVIVGVPSIILGFKTYRARKNQ